MPSNLTLTHGEHELDVTDRTTFGRTGDLTIAGNPFMHRVVGAVERRTDGWFLTCEGSSTNISLVDARGRRVNLPPGSSAVLDTTSGTIRWTSGGETYQLTYEIDEEPTAVTGLSLPTGEMTVGFVPQLTGREIDFSVTLARHVLSGSSLPPPTYVEVASLWFVSKKTVDNTLQNLKKKLVEAGMQPTASTAEMVSILVDTGHITYAHLEAADLDNPNGPTSAAGI